jgi:hypothetical protein
MQNTAYWKTVGLDALEAVGRHRLWALTRWLLAGTKLGLDGGSWTLLG